MITNFYMYMCYRFNAYLKGLHFYMYMRRNFFIFGRGPCGIVVLRGPGCQKGA